MKNQYIAKLKEKLGALEKKVASIENADTIPFSFFRDSFNDTQEIMRLIHEMESGHIEEMKQQMSKLVTLLYEAQNPPRNEAPPAPVQKPEPEPKPQPKPEPKPEPKPTINHQTSDNNNIKPAAANQTNNNIYAKGIILPEFKNPSPKAEPKEKPLNTTAAPTTAAAVSAATATTTLNDKIAPSATLSDTRLRLNLNDRFLFQRELFKNNREQMNNVMAKINSLQSLKEAEDYIAQIADWDTDSEPAKNFLQLIRKGFEQQ